MPKKPEITLKCRLKILAAEKDITIAEISRQTGIHQPTLSKLNSSSKKKLDIGLLTRLHEAYGWTLDDMFEFKEK